jgi:hypothetical protein
MGETNYYGAMNQWATRPPDERYWTPQEAFTASFARFQGMGEKSLKLHQLSAAVVGDNLALVGPKGNPASFTNWSFGQLMANIGFPGAACSALSPQLVAQIINERIRATQDAEKLLLMQRGTSGMVLRAFSSDRYERIWEHEVWQMLLDIQDRDGGWRNPPGRPPGIGDDPRARPATAEDILQISDGGGGVCVKIGDMITPAGNYDSDRDMYCFLVNEAQPRDLGNGELVKRFLAVQNSIVGDKKLKGIQGWYKGVCGNNIVWGTSEVREIEIKHLGNRARLRFDALRDQILNAMADDSAEAEDLRVLRGARQYQIAASKDKLIDLVFKQYRWLGKKDAEYCYAIAEVNRDTDGDPLTSWGYANGITRYSQKQPYAEDRMHMDRVAAQVIDLAR